MTDKELALLGAKLMNTKKAEDVMLIDIQGKATFADYFILATGSSDRQINALTDDIEDLYAEHGLILKSAEGKQGSGWILLDFGDIIVNLFTREMREKYAIEKVWADCPTIEVED